MCCWKILLCCLCGFVASTSGGRILAIMPTPSYSHQIVFNPLWRELSLRGHQVTLITTDPVKDPALKNLTEIDLHHTYQRHQRNIAQIVKFQKNNDMKGAAPFAIQMFANMTRGILDDQNVQDLINNKDHHFDLVLTETILPIMYAFGRRFNCPSVGLATRDVFHHNYHSMGNPSHPILNPQLFLKYGDELTFWDRLHIVYESYTGWSSFQDEIEKMAYELIKEYFGEGYPSVEQMEKNVDMLFLYVNPVIHRVRPLVPAIIHITGNMHIKPPKALPEEIQKTLDDAKNGAIYFSLGTNARSQNLPVETRNTLLRAFSELPYTILWKYEAEMTDLPEGNYANIKMAKWYPQQDIFNHSNIKLFITQGGLQSLEEAIHYQIPVLGLPVLGDQFTNTKRAASKGIGLQLDLDNLDKETFKSTISELIKNPKYKKNMRKASRIITDQPMTGLEKAVWWTEYLLRHKGARHLRSPMLDIPDYQYYLVDVIGFVLLVLLVAAYVTVKVVKLFIRLIKRVMLVSGTKVKTQ